VKKAGTKLASRTWPHFQIPMLSVPVVYGCCDYANYCKLLITILSYSKTIEMTYIAFRRPTMSSKGLVLEVCVDSIQSAVRFACAVVLVACQCALLIRSHSLAVALPMPVRIGLKYAGT
jgi:hypothetical protein